MLRRETGSLCFLSSNVYSDSMEFRVSLLVQSIHDSCHLHFRISVGKGRFVLEFFFSF